MAGLDRRRAVESRLQRRAALAIDRRRAHGLRPARDEHRLAPHVEGLLPDLRHAAHLDVLDLGRLDIESTDEPVQNLSRQFVRANLRERAAATPDRRANGVDDEGVSHVDDGTTEKSRQDPGTPFSSCSPRSTNSTPDPATRSRTVPVTRTSPGFAAPATRAPMATAMPPSLPS